MELPKEFAEREREGILNECPDISPEQLEKFIQQRSELHIRQCIAYMIETGQLESDGHGRVRLPPIN